ncbi:MAG: L-fucose/L-arabinose isomerase family protein [Candidatus Pacebacteria bacterium]|nr:L-fucose/L-arabinose isomerase family protein [Candidatus Paceibacterota bacterium]
MTIHNEERIMIRVGLLTMSRKRPGFDMDWGNDMHQGVLRQLEASGFELTVPETRIVDDASLRAALQECDQARADVLVVIQPTMSDGNLGVTIAQHAKTAVILWATPEKQDGDMISSCSLVGAHTFGSTLRLMNQPFELVYGMPGEPDTVEQLSKAVRLSAAARIMRSGKIGLVGNHAPGFIDMHASPWQTMRQLGVQLRHFSIEEYMAAAREMEAGRVQDDIEIIRGMSLPLKDIEEKDLDTAARLHLAMRDLIANESLNALAVRCWPELPQVMGQWPYLGMARLSEDEFPVACEGDVDGALSLWMGTLLGFGPGYLSDWLEHDDECVTLWHAGNAPFALLQPAEREDGPRLARHFNDRKPAVVEGTLTPGMPVTIFRLWSCDDTYHVAALEGQTETPRRPLMGTNGLARIDGGNVKQRFRTMLHAGMPHHVAVFKGHCSAMLQRFARLMTIKWLELTQ